MNLADAREMAKAVADLTYETESQKALIDDLKRGKFAPGVLTCPRETLLVCLCAINAPPELIQKAKDVVIQSSPEVPEDVMELARTAVRNGTMKIPALVFPDNAAADVEAALAELILPDGAFVDAEVRKVG